MPDLMQFFLLLQRFVAFEISPLRVELMELISRGRCRALLLTESTRPTKKSFASTGNLVCSPTIVGTPYLFCAVSQSSETHTRQCEGTCSSAYLRYPLVHGLSPRFGRASAFDPFLRRHLTVLLNQRTLSLPELERPNCGLQQMLSSWMRATSTYCRKFSISTPTKMDSCPRSK